MTVAYMKLGEGLGELMTNMVREFAYEDGQQEKAILVLVDSLQGMSVPQAKDVIEGRQKLVTTKDKKNMETVEDNWIPPDLKKMDDYIQKLIDVLFHARSSKIGSFARTLSEVSGIAKDDWIREARNIIEWRKANIIKAYRKAQSLFNEIYSYLQDYPGYSPGSSDLRTNIESPIIASIASSSLNDEDKVKMIRTTKGITGAVFEGVNIVIDVMFEYDTGWLNRDGIYYGCQLGQHIALSEQIINDFYPKIDISEAQEYLENKGWAKCSNSKWYYEGEGGLDPKQIQTLKDWSEKWGEPLSWNGHECTMSEIARKRGRIRY